MRFTGGQLPVKRIDFSGLPVPKLLRRAAVNSCGAVHGLTCRIEIDCCGFFPHVI